MNSSGIKRGLATTAVSALAIAGLPLFASSANAATGDQIRVAYVGPARDAGSEGAVVVLEVKGTITPAALDLVATDLVGNENNANQTVAIIERGTQVTDAASNEFGANGWDELTVRISVDTRNVGDTAKFAIYENDDATAGVQASEAAAQLEITTAGAPTAVQISPAGQTAPVGQPSGDYTATFKDSAGRTTQLTTGEQFNVTIAGPAAAQGSQSVSDSDITPAETRRGTKTFTATGGVGTDPASTGTGLRTITVAGAAPYASVQGTATLDVVAAASGITPAQVDIVTGADGWTRGTPGNAFSTTVPVRVDQSSVTVAINSPANAGKTVVLTATPAGGVRFGGKADPKSFTTVLDANGVGAIVITPDAGTITDAGSIGLSGAFALNLAFDRAEIQSVSADASSYVSKIGGSVDVTVRALDQFGLPAVGKFVAVQRQNGANADAAPSAKKQVDANGNAVFTLTDTKATPTSNAKDDVRAFAYEDQYASAPIPLVDADPGVAGTDVADIYYTADGLGNDFAITVDGVVPSGSAYDPASVSINPLTDANPNNAGDSTDEYIAVGVSNTTPGAAVTVSADNGALVLKNPGASTRLANGTASATGTSADVFRIVGTKAGLVNVTVVSAGRTKTAQVTVKALANNGATARNISVSGPEAGDSGEQVTFTAKVTDAFGNPVANFAYNPNLNVQVSGPGQLQDNDAVTNAAGELKLNVRLDEDADAPVTVRVQATGSQFGAAANRYDLSATTDNAPGLSASSNIATATISEVTNLEALREAVRVAQAAVDAAQADLTAANRDLRVATAELEVAQERVEAAKDRKQKARKALRKAIRKGKGIKAARANFREAKADLREARGEKKIAKVKVSAAQEIVDSAQAALEAAQAELEAAQQALEDAEND